MVIQFVEFTSGLSDEEVRRMIEVRAPEYREVAGLFQKFYVRNSGSGRYGGISIWADEDSLREAHDLDLEKSIRDVFRVEGLVDVETFEVMSVLHS